VITKVFPDEYHLHTLDQMLSAIARLNPHVDMKKIVIGLMDRLSTFALRESEGSSGEDKQKAEEEAAVKMLEKMRLDQSTKLEASKILEPDSSSRTNGTKLEEQTPEMDAGSIVSEATTAVNGDNASKAGKGDVKLFEIFYDQVVSLVKTRGLPIQDTMALLTSLVNLAL
jgi:vacuolar protein sorting-associated protein 35